MGGSTSKNGHGRRGKGVGDQPPKMYRGEEERGGGQPPKIYRGEEGKGGGRKILVMGLNTISFLDIIL